MSEDLPLLIPLVALGVLAACVMTALVHASAHVVLSRRELDVASRGPRPGISILKPLKGLDDDLESNLASLVDQDYDGPFEVLLGAADPDDPALEVARRLVARFPLHDIRVVAGHGEPGVNPKVANLAALSAHARYDAWLVSDSNVVVDRRYLESLAAELADPQVGMVSNVIAGVGAGTFGAVLENLHLNSFVVASVCAADVVARHPVVIGKSMLVRRQAMKRVGGWAYVADVLGEDYVLGAAVARAGYRVVLSSHIVQTRNRTWSVDRFLSRHLRWSQMRRSIAPAIYALEPLLNPLPGLALLAGLVAADAPAPSALLTVLAGVATVKIGLDALLVWRLRGRWPSTLEVAAIPLKDLGVFGMWVAAWFRDSVDWRGQRFRIGPGSRLIDEGGGAPGEADSLASSGRPSALTPPPPPPLRSVPDAPATSSRLARAPDRH